jgi:myxalamid-type polyketide synthase MxaE and MxaD
MGTWLVIEPGDAFDRSLLDALSGSRCVRVRLGTAFARDSAESYTVDPESPADFARLIGAIRADGGPPLQGIMHLGGIVASTAPWAPSELGAAVLRVCLSTLYLLRALNDASWDIAPRLWLVTRDSQRVRDHDSVTGLLGAPLWGLGKAIAVEHASFWGGLIDLDGEGDAARDAAALRWVMRASGDEDHLAFRGDAAYAMRLERRERKALSSSMRFRPEVSYLITGGLGELGLRIASWMVQQGARHLILLGRHGLPEREEWRAVDPETMTGRRIAAVLAVERLGAAVTVVQADVADEVAVRRFVDAHDRACRPPFGGVIHAAGTVELRLLVEAGADALAAQLLPKVQGSLVLHRVFAERPLDFLVYFSSGASVLNSPALGAYAAANSFLDVLAHHRRARGLVATSINWGFWEAGMATRDLPAAHCESAPKGMRTFTVEQGLELLGRLSMEAPVQVAVMPMDWTEWFDCHPEARRSPMLAVLREELRLGVHEEGVVARRPGDLRSRLEAAASESRQGILAKHIAHQVATVLRLPAEHIADDKPLGSLGLDSLMTMELRNRLESAIGVTLSVTMVWNYPTVSALTRYLLERIDLDATSAEPEKGPAKVEGKPHFEEEVAAMSNEDAERMLMAELDSLDL